MAVLLHRDAPDGDHHDLLLERESGDDRRLIAFRLDGLTDLFEVAEFAAERIRDHRAVYLEYEGPLPAPGPSSSQAVGRVERVFAARCTIHVDTPDFLDVTFDDPPRAARFIAERITGTSHDGLGEWRFTRG